MKQNYSPSRKTEVGLITKLQNKIIQDSQKLRLTSPLQTTLNSSAQSQHPDIS